MLQTLYNLYSLKILYNLYLLQTLATYQENNLVKRTGGQGDHYRFTRCLNDSFSSEQH